MSSETEHNHSSNYSAEGGEGRSWMPNFCSGIQEGRGFVTAERVRHPHCFAYLLPACRCFPFMSGALFHGSESSPLTGAWWGCNTPWPRTFTLLSVLCPSGCCVCASFHSPAPRAWCKTTGIPQEAQVLAVVGRETRGTYPAAADFSAGSTAAGCGSLCCDLAPHLSVLVYAVPW